MPSAPHPAPTPEDHLRRFRATGDAGALGALFEATAPALLRVALATAPDPASAENALQETFLAVLAAPERWDDTRPVLPWLLGILHRQVGTTRRDRARVPDPFRVPPPLREGDPAAAAASREEEERVRAAIDELPEPYRQVALLRWRHGLDPAEIADLRGEPPGTTRSLLSRALDKLRTRLGAVAFAWFGGGPTMRGLDAIRREIVRRAALEGVRTAAGGAAAGVARSGTTATVAAVAGGLAMKKVLAVCVALVLLALGAWGVVEWTAAPETPTAAPDGESAAAPRSETPRVRARVPAAPSAAPADALPPPVDWGALDPDRDVAGRVLGPDGAPVAGARVQVREQSWARLSGWLGPRDEDGPETSTATDGSFRLRVAPAEPFAIVVRAAGFIDHVREQCRAGHRLTIRLADGTPFAVLVVEADGRAAAGATVSLSETDPYGAASHRAEATTDAGGRAAFEHVPPDMVRLAVRVPGVRGSHSPSGVLRAPQSEPARIVLPARATVTGCVTDRATGAPIAGASLGAYSVTGDVVTTGADGRYTLTSWAWGRSTRIAAAAPGYGAQSAKLASPGTLDFALDRAFAVRGRAVDTDRSPVADARAAVLERPDDTSSPTASAATADTDGCFEIAAAVPGRTHVLVVAAPGRSRVVVELPAAPPGGADAFDAGDVVLHRGRRVSGVVVDADGAPCPGDHVSASRRGVDASPWSSAEAIAYVHDGVVTDDLGRFRFDALPPGEWWIGFSATDAPAIPPVHVVVPADRDVEGVRVVLPGARTLTVRVVDDTGAPIDEASIQVMGDFGQVGRSVHPLDRWTTPDGRARFRGLPAAPVRVFASVSIDRAFIRVDPAPTVVPEGQEVTIVLARAVPVSGTVVDDEGRPLDRLCLDARIAGDVLGTGIGVAVTQADGRFSLMVPAGRVVDVRLRGDRTEMLPDGVQRSIPCEWHGQVPGIRGPAAGLVLHASKAPEALDRRLTVLVLDTTGAPVAEIEVRASWAMKDARATTDASGRAVLEKLPAERVRIWFSTGMRREPVHAFDVAPAPIDVVPDSQEVTAPFRAGAALRGRLVDADGKPVRGSVTVRMPEYAYTHAASDADGRVVVAALPGVAHHVEADATVDGVHLQAVRAGVVPGEGEVVLVLAPALKER